MELLLAAPGSRQKIKSDRARQAFNLLYSSFCHAVSLSITLRRRLPEDVVGNDTLLQGVQKDVKDDSLSLRIVKRRHPSDSMNPLAHRSA